MYSFLKNDSISIKEKNGKKIIYAPKGTMYLSEIFRTLPAGIFNKHETGCGATSVILENEEDIIICCPSKGLIHNKVSQYPVMDRCIYKLLGVYEGITKTDIQTYIIECRQLGQPVKIMTTYESFYKVKEALEESLNEYKIVVDEYHELLGSISFRDKGILRLLKDLDSLQNVTYLSATPIGFPYRPNELSGLDEWEIHWEDSAKISVIRKKSSKPYGSVENIISDLKNGSPLEINGHKVKQYFFFINSVTGIKNIIDNAGLTNEDVAVICANTKKNSNTLGDIRITGVEHDITKPFIFCTKSVFYGADFYSDAGLIVVVSDARNRNTMLDISTDIQQIAGRIRNKNNPFRHLIYHIFSTRIGGKTEEEFESYINDKVEQASALMDLYNSEKITPMQKKALLNKIRVKENDDLLIYNEEIDSLEINELKKKYLIYQFKSIDSVYRNGVSIRDKYMQEGWDVTQAQEWEEVAKEFIENVTNRSKFQTLYEEYYLERKRVPRGKSDEALAMEKSNSLVLDAYNYMTKEEVRKAYYNPTIIRNIIHSRLPETKNAVKESLEKNIVVGRKYSAKDIKQYLKEAYEHAFISLAPTSKDIHKYYEVRETKVTRGRKRVMGYQIVKKWDESVTMISYIGEGNSRGYLKDTISFICKLKSFLEIFFHPFKRHNPYNINYTYCLTCKEKITEIFFERSSISTHTL